MKKLLFILVFFAGFFSSQHSISAQVVINEVMNNPSGTEEGAEWVELYNKSDQPISLKGCSLQLDDTSTTQVVHLGDGDFIEKFKVISWDRSWLNNSGDILIFDCPGFNDSVSYGNQAGSVLAAPQDGKSFGRIPDGSGNFALLNIYTLGETNSSPVSSTPNPTFTPIPTEKPTPTVKPSPTTKPSHTPTPSITPKPTATISPGKTSTPTKADKTFSPTFTQQLSIEDNLFDTTGSDTGTMPSLGIQKVMEKEKNATKSSVLAGNTQRQPPYAAFTFIYLGVICIGISVFPILKNFKKSV